MSLITDRIWEEIREDFSCHPNPEIWAEIAAYFHGDFELAVLPFEYVVGKFDQVELSSLSLAALAALEACIAQAIRLHYSPC